MSMYVFWHVGKWDFNLFISRLFRRYLCELCQSAYSHQPQKYARNLALVHHLCYDELGRALTS